MHPETVGGHPPRRARSGTRFERAPPVLPLHEGKLRQVRGAGQLDAGKGGSPFFIRCFRFSCLLLTAWRQLPTGGVAIRGNFPQAACVLAGE